MKVVKLFEKYTIYGLTLEHLHLIEALASHVHVSGKYGELACTLARIIDNHPDTEGIARVSSKHKYLEAITINPVIIVN